MTEIDNSSLRPKVEFVISREEFCAKSTLRLGKALEEASRVHENDIRTSTGEPYINHCIAVAESLREWGADEDTQVAGLLHDTVEDHPDLITLEDIVEKFGERVARIVFGLTGCNDDIKDQQKVVKEAQEELSIVLVKCADRLHNLMTMNGFDDERKAAKGRETLEVYVPMAESLGLWQVKNALADISFSFTEPAKYKKVREYIDNDPRLNSDFIIRTKERIKNILKEAGLIAEVEHQVGGYWELSEKQRKSGKWFVDITDVVSFRVITGDEYNLGECYRAMGIIRTKFGESIRLERSDDFIAVPAKNLYSALHDSYRFQQGIIEVAFTTRKREDFNNRGVASLSQEELAVDIEKYRSCLKLAFSE